MNALAFLSIYIFFCFNLFIWNNICKLIERTIQVSMSGNPENLFYFVFFLMSWKLISVIFNISNLV